MVGDPVFAILPVTDLTALGEKLCSFFHGPASDRKFLSLRTNHAVKGLDFRLA
jgi:hypothetical protein